MPKYQYHLSFKFTSFNLSKTVTLRPMIPVILQYKNNLEIAALMLLDSGADFSLISQDLGRSLNIDVNKKADGSVKGVTGETATIEEMVKIQFGMGSRNTFKKEIPIHITKKDGFPTLPLLGRDPLFNEFDIHFRLGLEESKRKFVLDKL
jgi:hypothetical protein